MTCHSSLVKARERRAARERVAEARAASQLTQRVCRLHHSRTPGGFVGGGRPALNKDRVDLQQLQCYKDQMLANGWCNHQVDHLSKLHDMETFAYLATRPRSPHRLVDHKQCLNHSTCVAYNTSASTYKTRHATAECTCPMISTPYSLLTDIIRKGKIPLVSIEDSDDTVATLRLRVYPRSSTSKYIAISHVWIDGLGNPNTNALPLCQIKKLETRLMTLQTILRDVEKFEGPVLFWLDTLCIPTGRDDLSLRLAQIDKMASIYKGAVSGLVLDAELMSMTPDRELESNHDFDDPGTVIDERWKLGREARACIACSAWMSRSWTLQEGQLPRTIAIQFLDNTIVFGRHSLADGSFVERSTCGIGLQLEESSASSHPSSWAGQKVTTQINDHQPSVRSNTQIEGEPFVQCDCVSIALERAFFSVFFQETTGFAAVWNELAGRSTTMPRDIPFIITNILDMENTELLKYQKPSEMLQAIILSLDAVPLSILFNTGPKQDQDGDHRNRWVPEKIGTDTLMLGSFVTVCRTYFLYRHLSRDSTPEVSAYMINAIIPLESETNVYLGDDDTVYCVDFCRSAADRLNTKRFTSTCILVEDNQLHEQSGVKRGACFYFHDDDEAETDSCPYQNHNFLCYGFHRPDPNQIPAIVMTFNCPIRLQRVARSEILLKDPMNTHKLRPIENRTDIKILHDPLCNFKPLRNRQSRRLDILAIAYLLGGLVAMQAIIAFHMIRGYSGCVAVIVGLYFELILCLLGNTYLDPALAKWSAWSYIRSFEAIAACRPRRNNYM